METEFLNTEQTKNKLIELIKSFDEYYWAIAWATDHELTTLLNDNRQKIKKIVLGVTGGLTSPDFLEIYKGSTKVKIVDPSLSQGIFHPKLYLFFSGRTASAIVGSANFTNGGLKHNEEASIFISGSPSSPPFAEMKKFIDEKHCQASEITKEYLEKYRSYYNRAKNEREAQAEAPGIESSAIDMSWHDYLDAIRIQDERRLEPRLMMLQTAQRWFAEFGSFSRFEIDQRRAVAGTIGANQRRQSDDNNVRDCEWGWFGPAGVQATFMRFVNQNEPRLVEAVDSIPFKGDISEHDYRNYLELLSEAFVDEIPNPHFTIASRFLVMKRPDIFSSLNGGNRSGLNVLFGIKIGTRLDEQNIGLYWNGIVQRAQQTEWYNSKRPQKLENEIEAQIWDFRCAMLDSLVYSA